MEVVGLVRMESSLVVEGRSEARLSEAKAATEPPPMLSRVSEAKGRSDPTTIDSWLSGGWAVGSGLVVSWLLWAGGP